MIFQLSNTLNRIRRHRNRLDIKVESIDVDVLILLGRNTKNTSNTTNHLFIHLLKD